MNLSWKEENLLQRLLKKYPDKLYDRGYELYENEAVTFDSNDEEIHTNYFSVKGIQEPNYKVEICLDADLVFLDKKVNQEFAYQCSCIYYEENKKCKHIAAALIFMDESVDNLPDFSSKSTLNNPGITPLFPTGTTTTKTEEVGLPMEIACREEDLKNLGKLIPKGNSFSYSTVQSAKLLDSGIWYFVYLGGYPVEFTVQYLQEKQALRISTGDKRKWIHQYIFYFLQNWYSNPENLDLMLFTKSLRKQLRLNKLEAMGLLGEVSNPDRAFEIGFQNKAFRLFFSGELEGLKNITLLGEGLGKFVSEKLDFLDPEKLEKSPESKEFGSYNVGFALEIHAKSKLNNVVPFIAKGKKQDPEGFHVRFEYLNDPFDLRLAKNDNLEQIFTDIRQFGILRESPDQQVSFEKFQQLLSQLRDEYPIFVSTGYGFGYPKPRKENFNPITQIRDAELELNLTRNKSIIELKVWIVFGDQRIDLSIDQSNLILTQAFGLWQNQELLIFKDYRTMKILEYFKPLVPCKFVEKDFDLFFEKVIRSIVPFVRFSDDLGLIQSRDSDSVLQKELYISELSGLIIFKPAVRYTEDLRSNPLMDSTLLDVESRSILLKNDQFEAEFVDFLKSLHPAFAKSGAQGFFHLNQRQFSDGKWFLEAFETLKEAGVHVFGLDNLKIKRYSPYPAVVSMGFSSKSDWFEIDSQLSFGNYSVRLKDIRKAFDAGEKFVPLGDGSLGVIPERWMKKILRLLRSGEVLEDKIKLSKIHFNLLSEFEEAENFPEVQKELLEKKNRLLEFNEIRAVQVSPSVKADLRSYQKAGLNWLNFLHEFGWGGILADDMGLGKTLQVIALISQLSEKGNTRILIVAPTTLIFNWKNELGKFAPHLDYLIHHGQRYDSAEDLRNHSVILTSYGLVINDLDLLSKIDFDLIVADESQAIKNVSSLRYKAITKLKSKFKLALTGTPIENGISELFAQMNFVNPGFFRSFSHFTDNYLKELKNGNPEILGELKQKIQPFILRRTKEEVLTELPEKTEEYLYCEMGSAQKKIYEAYRNEYRDYLLKKFDEEGANQSKMYVLEGLTKLRQICDSPKLIQPTDSAENSTKIDLLMEHIQEKTGSHKVLIFSQFVKMLDLVRVNLEKLSISYSYLDGQTSLKEREHTVNRFQDESQIRVFLISIKAGGTGLNLTAADYVYILDPWWNPAVENQAIDRCYRMGQERHVMAYRMICRDTVEEKIMELQKAKSKLAKEVISEGDGFLAQMDRDAMLRLFE